jgi:hypothetical protein
MMRHPFIGSGQTEVLRSIQIEGFLLSLMDMRFSYFIYIYIYLFIYFLSIRNSTTLGDFVVTIL